MPGKRKEVKLENFEAFEKEINSLQKEAEQQAKKEPHDRPFHNLLFRGHASKDWRLRTTLERFFQERNLKVTEWPWRDYYHILLAVLPSVKSLTSNKYELPTEPKYRLLWEPPGYEFMVYLRHHGFPSPLLDWTVSPYVAAFFAFNEAKERDEIAIFSFMDRSSDTKGGTLNRPGITQLGPYAVTHKRHHIQQCQYTYCAKYDENKDLIYCCHEDVEFGDDQDILTKYILPASERKKVLKKLDLMNINAFSLFGNEEGLMNTLAYREIERHWE